MHRLEAQLSRLRSFETSRRDMLAGPFGAAAALGALNMLGGAEAKAAAGTADSQAHPVNIDPALLTALQFDRENSEDPGLVFLPGTGFLVGFGPNLLHCDTSTDMCRLFSKGRQVLTSSVTEDVAGNIAALVIGTRGTTTGTVQDSSGRSITTTVVVEAIDDVPDDFLITDNTQSAIFTGAFFKITMTISVPQGDIVQIKTTFNLLTRSFPLGLNVSFGPAVRIPASSIIDVNAASLQGIAVQIIATRLAALSAFTLTGLQQDFPWQEIYHAVAFIFFTAVTVLGVSTGNEPLALAAGSLAGAYGGKVVDDLEPIFFPKQPP